jgi:hypothetical protein
MRLIFISDSRQQWSGDYGSKVPAISLFHDERYVVLRHALDNGAAGNLKVVIVSAKYGFINANYPIRAYGNGLTFEKVDRLTPAFKKQWDANVSKWFEGVDDLFLGVTGPYLYALQRMEIAIHWIPKVGKVFYMYAPFQVRDWLDGKRIMDE